jgi:ethanolamine utilization cobalamin adenosyltransferase
LLNKKHFKLKNFNDLKITDRVSSINLKHNYDSLFNNKQLLIKNITTNIIHKKNYKYEILAENVINYLNKKNELKKYNHNPVVFLSKNKLTNDFTNNIYDIDLSKFKIMKKI